MGTRAPEAPELAQAIAAAWPADRPRLALRALRSCGSTMDVARAWHREGAVRAAVVALEQTAGRGRLGRRFVSPRGGLYVTAILPAPARLDLAFRLGFAAAVAARDAVRAAAGETVEFDWPNDLVGDRGKVGGILSELVTGTGSRPPAVLVGVGLNAGPDPRAVEPGSAGPAAPLARAGAIDLARLAAELLAGLDALADVGERDGRWRFVLQCVEASMRRTAGEPVALRAPDGRRIAGRVAGLAWDGSLRLAGPDGRERLVRYGEVERMES
ncbi:MAG: biotin--[acetyl-CoA-carboxylase] ligase [Acidobacteria bacterium]|nr:MAG: biotin--[acetyl-CoA-carboxylase] ligase [Acidobacteriota bacterium]